MKKFSWKLLFQILIIVIALFIAWTWNYTSLFVKNRSVPDHYLPVDDYFLVNTETGEKPSLKNLTFDTQYAYQTTNLETTFGLKPGDSFEKVIELYGDYYCDSITISVDKDEEPIYDYIEGPLLIKDFYRDYIQSGTFDLNNTNIDIHFLLYISGKEIYYTHDEQEELVNQYYDSSFWIGYHTFSFFKPKIQSLQMSISYIHPGKYTSFDEGGIFDIMTYRYTH